MNRPTRRSPAARVAESRSALRWYMIVSFRGAGPTRRGSHSENHSEQRADDNGWAGGAQWPGARRGGKHGQGTRTQGIDAREGGKEDPEEVGRCEEAKAEGHPRERAALGAD